MKLFNWYGKDFSGQKLRKRSNILLIVLVYVCAKRNFTSKKQHHFFQYAHQHKIKGADFKHLEKSSGGFEYILKTTDHVSRYTQAYPTRNKITKTATYHLYNNFILRFEISSKILICSRREFENKLFRQLANLLGVNNLRTTLYHPQANCLTEDMD